MIKVRTTRPQALLNAIAAAIKDGTIKTWLRDAEGDLSHTETNNNVKDGWFRPKVEASSAIEFTLIKRKGEPNLDDFSYAYYHGKLVQMLVLHFSDGFSVIEIYPRGLLFFARLAQLANIVAGIQV